MATRKIACYGDCLVILEDNKIIERLEDKGLEAEIDNVILKGIAKRPVQIFKAAVEKNTGLSFVTSPIIYGISCSIHDQEIYKMYRDKYILSHEKIKKVKRMEEDRKEAERRYKQKESIFVDYNIRRRTRILKDVSKTKDKKKF